MKEEMFLLLNLILREIISIGTAHFAAALLKLIDKTVIVTVPEINWVPINKTPEMLGSPELPIVGLYFKILSDLKDKILQKS